MLIALLACGVTLGASYFIFRPRPDRWLALQFDGSPQQRVVSLRLTIPASIDAEINRGLGLQPVSMTTNDEADLAEIEGVNIDAVRFAMAPNISLAGGQMAWGLLELKKSDGSRVVCGMSRAGFLLDSTNGNSKDMFWSTTLANVANRVYERRTGQRIPEYLLNSLQGLTRPEESQSADETSAHADHP